MKWLCALGGVTSVAVAGCAVDGTTGLRQATPLTTENTARVVQTQPSYGLAPSQAAGASTTTTATYAQTGSPRLNAGQITSLLSGKSIKQVDDQFTATFHSSGVISAEYYNASQKGTWQVSGGKICQSFTEWNSGQPTCFDVLRGNGGLYRFHDTSNNDGYTFTVR